MGLAEQAQPEIRGPAQIVWLERLDAELDNLRTALESSRADPDGAETELRLAGALQWVWFIRGQWSEGRRWLEDALARGTDAPPSVLSKALQGATYLAWGQGDYERAVALCGKGLTLCREWGDKEGIARFLIHWGMVAMYQGDYQRATALCEDGLALCRERGDKWLISWALTQVGSAAHLQRDYERAVALHEESLALARKTGDKYRIAFVLRSLGHVALFQGDYRQAAARFKESLTLCKEVADERVTGECLVGLAGVACAQGLYDQAARLFAAAEVLREATGYHYAAARQADIEQFVSSTRAGLGESVFATAWAEGRAMTLEQAIEYALEVADGATKRNSS